MANTADRARTLVLSSAARAGGAYGFAHYFFEEVGGEVIATLVGGPLGEQVRPNLPYVQLKKLYDQESALPKELKMPWEELGALVQQLDVLRVATEKYQDAGLALADRSPNMGAPSFTPSA